MVDPLAPVFAASATAAEHNAETVAPVTSGTSVHLPLEVRPAGTATVEPQDDEAADTADAAAPITSVEGYWTLLPPAAAEQLRLFLDALQLFTPEGAAAAIAAEGTAMVSSC